MGAAYRPYSWPSKAEAAAVCMKAARVCDVIVSIDDEFAVLAEGGSGLDCAASLAREGGRIVVCGLGAKGASPLPMARCSTPRSTPLGAEPRRSR